jgi:hypothetical protein
MTAQQTNDRLTVKALRQITWWIIIETALIFVLPPNHVTMRLHHFSPLEYRIVLFTVTLPALTSWVAAFFGYAKLQEYVSMIKDTPEGPHFAKLAVGCTWLAWSLPISATLSLCLSATANHWSGFYPAAVIIRNYANLGFSLIAFSIIGGSSRNMVNYAKLKFSLVSVRLIITLFLLAGVLYCYLTFKHFDLTSLSSTHNSYYLPIWLMVISVMIPYLYTWFSGLLAAYEINLFSKRADGVLYRRPLRLLAIGLLIIIISFVALQYTSSLHPDIGPVNLDYRRLLTSLFRIMSGVGFVMLGYGALRLKKIEEV